jgi:hypothetical protein
MLERMSNVARGANQAFYENVSKPAVGTAIDMTLGLGDLVQMGARYLGNRAGLDAGEFTSVAQPVKEALGVEDYNPYTVGGLGASILPFATAGRAAAATTRALPGAMLSPTGSPSAARQLSSMFPNLGRETGAYVAAEIGAAAAGELAPDSALAQVAGAALGSTGANIALGSARAGIVNPGGTYQYTPTPTQPFVGRLDQYIGSLDPETSINIPKLLSELRSEKVKIARSYEIQRVQRMLREVGPNEKFTPGQILEKLQAAYDPSRIQIDDSTVKWGRSVMKDMPYSSMDNPWATSLNTQPQSGFSIVMRMPDSGAVSEKVVKGAQNAVTRLNELPSNINMTGADTPYILLTSSGLNDFAQSFIDAFEGGGSTRPIAQSTLATLESMRRNQLKHDINTKKIYEFKNGVEGDLHGPRGFNEEKNRLLQVGGLPNRQLLDQAYVNAFSYSYQDRLGDLRSGLGIRVDQLPQFDSRAVASPEAIQNFFKKEVAPATRRLVNDAQKDMEDYATFELEGLRDNPELRSLLSSLSTQNIPALGSNPGFMGKPGHTSVTGGLDNIISFTRASEVTSDIPGMGPTKGIYVHELQSDLANRVRESGGPRTLDREGVEKRLVAAEKGYDAVKQRQLAIEAELNDLDTRSGELIDLQNNFPDVDYLQEINDLRDQRISATERAFAEHHKARSFKTRIDNIKERIRDPNSASLDLVDETFIGMDTNSEVLQQMLIKGAVGSALNRGLNFVALTALEHSAKPELYKSLPKNAQSVVEDLGKGFSVKEIELKNDDGPFKTLAIVWDQQDASKRFVDPIR